MEEPQSPEVSQAGELSVFFLQRYESNLTEGGALFQKGVLAGPL